MNGGVPCDFKEVMAPSNERMRTKAHKNRKGRVVNLNQLSTQGTEPIEFGFIRRGTHIRLFRIFTFVF